MTEPTPMNELSYEQALSELEAVVADLESDQHSLEEAIALFERGQALLRHCSGLLDKADMQVQQLLDDQIIPFDE